MTAVNATRRQSKSTLGGADKQFEIFSVLNRQWFVTLKSEQGSKLGVPVHAVSRSGPGSPAGAFSYFGHDTPPPARSRSVMRWRCSSFSSTSSREYMIMAEVMRWTMRSAELSPGGLQYVSRARCQMASWR